MAVIQLDAANEAALAVAFEQYENLPATCPVETVPGTVYLAKIKATGVSFAVAGFKPTPACQVLSEGKIGPPPPNYGPFGEIPPPPVGVFQDQPGAPWVMNSEAGVPYPCPPQPGERPAKYNSMVPPEVIAAWKLPYYSSTCVTYLRSPP
ncbi:MAG: hypothetical protein M3R71_00100 [Actinomycetota bacterium]|nr:hypothetical protein [Actinomycetota bacterium]